jgi:hypothetical protein
LKSWNQDGEHPVPRRSATTSNAFFMGISLQELLNLCYKAAMLAWWNGRHNQILLDLIAEKRGGSIPSASTILRVWRKGRRRRLKIVRRNP